MKQTSTILFLLLSLAAVSQKAMTFRDAGAAGITTSMLDSIYPSGLHSDSTKAVFGDRQEQFVQAYKQTLRDLGAFLKTNQFTWDKQTKCFNRIYFNKDGRIDFFLYNFGKDGPSPEKEKLFDSLLNRFIKDYRFPLTAETGFSQCSPVRYGD